MDSEELDRTQLLKATNALLKHVELKKANSHKSNLIEEFEFIHVQVALIKIPERNSSKPRQIRIPNPLYKAKEEGDVQMCLIVKDDCKKDIKKLLMEDTPVAGLTKVLSLSKLKREFGRFADRRELMHAFDIFLADDRILPEMSKALGKKFYQHKKMPVPVKVRRSSFLPQNIAAARDATFLVMGAGPCLSVRSARSDMAAEQIADNIEAVLEGMMQYIPKQWKNVRSVNIKTSSSVALPIYAALPDVPTRIASTIPQVKDPHQENNAGAKKKARKRKKKRPLLELAASLQAAAKAKSNEPEDYGKAQTNKEEITLISPPATLRKSKKKKKQ